jgi:hypothetical protein
MAENIPELAVIDDFHSSAYDPDDNGIYKTVDYRRMDGTLYMRSTLSQSLGKGMYGNVKLSYFDRTGTVLLHDIIWELQYDINKKIISKRVK